MRSLSSAHCTCIALELVVKLAAPTPPHPLALWLASETSEKNALDWRVWHHHLPEHWGLRVCVWHKLLHGVDRVQKL